jgi:RHS repeat-associated protein
VNAATNQLSGYTYDNNGNLISTGYTYDAENRIEYANAGAVQYFYDGQNKRIWQTTCTTNCTPGTNWTLNAEVVNLFGADGKQLASYTPSASWSTGQITFTMASERAYFGGKLVAQVNPSYGYLTAAVQDRLGSVGKYYPYGEDRTGQPGSDSVRFATYTRDSATGNDYADQRYYSSALGRFLTPDPSRRSATPTNPQSWSRYTYALGNPVNGIDPKGLSCLAVDEFDFDDPEFIDNSDNCGQGGSCDPFDASCGNPCVAADGFTPIPGPTCPVIPGVPSPSQVAVTVVPKYLVITLDCYKVPTNGGAVTRDIDYQVYGSDGNPYGFGTVWEHLTGDLPLTGADSPSSGPPGTFDDEQSVVNLVGIQTMHVTQTFSDHLPNGTAVPLFVRGFGGDFGTLDIIKTNGAIYINGNAGGQVDPKTGKLIPGTYTPCN